MQLNRASMVSYKRALDGLLTTYREFVVRVFYISVCAVVFLFTAYGLTMHTARLEHPSRYYRSVIGGSVA